MKRKYATAAAFFAAFCVSCGQQAQDPEPVERQFPMVKVPSLVTDRQEAMEYGTLHYWDAFADTSAAYLTDSAHIAGVKRPEVEQAMANYIALLKRQPIDKMRKSVGRMYERLSLFEEHDPADSSFEKTVALIDTYFYDPNSPLRSEELYLPFCEKMAQSPYVDETLRGKYAFEARRCSLNRIGETAADFEFADKKGKTRHMHDIKAANTLLFFSNPGCHACKEIMDRLNSISQIREMIADGRLAVLNIYIDEDRDAWYEYMPIYPETWYNGYDPNLKIRGDELYSIRAIPSLYLLDSEKRVMLKDADENEVYDTLLNIYGGR